MQLSQPRYTYHSSKSIILLLLLIFDQLKPGVQLFVYGSVHKISKIQYW